MKKYPTPAQRVLIDKLHKQIGDGESSDSLEDMTFGEVGELIDELKQQAYSANLRKRYGPQYG